MGILNLFEWIERKLDKPSERGLLLEEGRNRGSEAMITADTPSEAKAAGKTVRRRRLARTIRWHNRA
jgi:hypothetical protein